LNPSYREQLPRPTSSPLGEYEAEPSEVFLTVLK